VEDKPFASYGGFVRRNKKLCFQYGLCGAAMPNVLLSAPLD
jgi:hypothetical protein